MKNLILLLLLLFVSCKLTSEKTSEIATSEILHLEARIDSLFNSEVKEEEPGAALLISFEGKMLIGKGYDLQYLETKKAITTSTNMRMASVSKQFTALAILSLVDKNELSLSDSVYFFSI